MGQKRKKLKKGHDIIPNIWNKVNMKKGYLTDELANEIFNFIPNLKAHSQSGTGLAVTRISIGKTSSGKSRY